jgi:glycosyltransferase involved in cell wall biosynthesis
MATSAGDWGGASRFLFVLLKNLDRTRFEPLALFPEEGPIFQTLDQMGIRHKVWRTCHYTNPLTYVADIYRSARLFKRERIDLLHINYGGFWRMAEVEAARLSGIPVLAHQHLVVEKPGPSLRRCDLAIANSHFTGAASDFGGTPFAVMHNMVDLDRYDAATDIRPELGIGVEDIVITFIGQIRRNKGVDMLIDAAASIPDPRVRFLIVGECRDKSRFPDAYTPESLAADIAHDSRIRYVGYRSDIQNVYCSSDIIVMPSRWDEPFGLINIEAGASRKPIVAAAVGGIPEIIVHGETGFLFERGDLAGFAEHLRRLVDDPDLRTRMGAAARLHVEQHFTDAPVEALMEIYDEVLVSKSRSGPDCSSQRLGLKAFHAKPISNRILGNQRR